MPMTWTPSIERAYAERKNEMIRSALLTGLLVAATLYPAFLSLDYLTHSEKLPGMALNRIITGMFFLLFRCYAARRNHVLRFPFRTFLFLFYLGAASLVSLCVYLGGYTSNYYAGLLVILVVANLFPWTAFQMVVSMAGVIFMYALAMLIHAGFHIERPDVFMVNLYVLSSVGIVSIACAGIAERLRRQNFMQILEIEQASEEISKLLQIRTRFFANVSHELRTPLALILGPARRLLSMGSLPQQSEIELNTIERNVRVLLKHVNDLLDAAKGDNGTIRIQFNRVDLCSLIRLCASRFEHLAAERGNRFELELPDSLVGEVDPQKLDRIITNLLSNAFKFTPRGGTIRLRAYQDHQSAPPRAVVKVCDSGPGIPPELRTHIFERFFQVEESSKRRHGGTGLGLAIVKDCVELHRGEISVGQSEEGGAEFSVVLPLQAPVGSVVEEFSPAPAQEYFEDSSMAVSEPVITESQPPSDAGKVLVVEDNVEMNGFLHRILNPRWKVETVFDGRQALQVALSRRPDVILTDLMMPEVSGEELLVALRQCPELADVPVIVLTAKADDNLRSELLLKGAQDFQLKPFSPDELVARINIWMEVKRSRELLQRELKTHKGGLVQLAQEITEKSLQLRDALETAEAAKLGAQKSRELRDQFIAVASHELRTPLTALRLQIRLSQQTTQDDSISTALVSMDQQVNHLSRLVNEMFDLSRIDQGKLELKKSKFGVVGLLRAILAKYDLQLKGRAEFVNLVSEDDPKVQWDRSRIEQVFTNLLINAIKYGAGKQIRIVVKADHEQITVHFKDHGIGIAQRDQDKIFERFERCVPYEKISGLGLGLYISREIVRAHGGTMTVESQPGEGSVFSVLIPRSTELAANLIFSALPEIEAAEIIA